MVEAIARARDIHAFRLWAWVVMPEHVHLLVWPRNEAPAIGPILTSIKQSVARKALAWVQRNAPEFLPRMADVSPAGRTVYRFWQRGAGYDRNLWTPRHVREAIEYIHNNPVERGLCGRAVDWAWSSAREYETPGSGLLRVDRESVPGST